MGSGPHSPVKKRSQMQTYHNEIPVSSSCQSHQRQRESEKGWLASDHANSKKQGSLRTFIGEHEKSTRSRLLMKAPRFHCCDRGQVVLALKLSCTLLFLEARNEGAGETTKMHALLQSWANIGGKDGREIEGTYVLGVACTRQDERCGR
jgi:hypothetical protein